MLYGASVGIVLLGIVVPSARAAFDFSAPLECQDFSVSWSGGNAPFSLLVAPVGQAARNLSIPDSAFSDGRGNYTQQLAVPAQRRFILVLSDASGFGSLGTSQILTVGNPPQNSASCNTAGPSPTIAPDYSDSDLQQCSNFVFGNLGNASRPVTIYALTPPSSVSSITSFPIRVPQSATSSYTWQATLQLGTSALFAPKDSNNNFGVSSDFLNVGSSDSSSCLATVTTTGNGGGSSPTSNAPGSTPTDGGGGGGGGGGSSSNTGAIAGGVVGGIVGLLALLGLVLFLLRRKRRANDRLAAQSGFTGGAFGKAGKRGTQIDLLPTTANGRGQRDGDAARYPLSGPDHEDRNGRDDYEPVPYVFPTAGAGGAAGAGARPSQSGGSDSGTQSSSQPLSPGATATTNAAGFSTFGNRDKSAMASMDRTNSEFAPNAPARFVVHQDAGSVAGDDDDEEGEWSEDEVVDLPPQYNSLGVLIPPERRPSRRRSTRRPAEGGVGPSASGANSTGMQGPRDGGSLDAPRST